MYIVYLLCKVRVLVVKSILILLLLLLNACLFPQDDLELDNSGDLNELDSSIVDSIQLDSASLGDTILKESFIDDRDGEEYQYVQIGKKYWMAENLRYLPRIDTLISILERKGPYNYYVPTLLDEPRYIIYDHVPQALSPEEQLAEARQTYNYKNYGVLYNWLAAMDNDPGHFLSEEDASGFTESQGICPNGWRMPTILDWQQLLIETIQDQGYPSFHLQIKSSSDLWGAGEVGSDPFGFSVLPTGRGVMNEWYEEEDYLGFGEIAYLWSSTHGNCSIQGTEAICYGSDEGLERHASALYLGVTKTRHTFDTTKKLNFFSVRCIKD